MKILCCGDRNWNDLDTVLEILVTFSKEAIIIHGDCRGADRTCGAIANELGFTVKAFPADWDKYGKSAGPIRNREMIKEMPDEVIAFHDSIETPKGTKDMLNVAKRQMSNVE